MNFQGTPTGKSPRRELQGPRPTPLRINKDSHKIKKPPVAPQPQPPPRQPVIIYTVSPKVIHTTPGEFMSLVQRLTGSSSSSSSSSSSDVLLNDPFKGNNGGDTVSPAALFAAIEKTKPPQGKKQHSSGENGDVGGVEMMSHEVERPSDTFHGILSPAPASLSSFPSSFFSPPSSSDPSMVSFLHDLSPVLHSNRNFMEGSFVMPSPSNFVSPYTPSIDLYNNFFN